MCPERTPDSLAEGRQALRQARRQDQRQLADKAYLQRLSRELIDQGKLIEAGWLGLRITCDLHADRLISDGGWISRKGVTCFNLYRPPLIIACNGAESRRWLDHAD